MKIEGHICTATLEMTSNQHHGTTGGNHLKSADRESKSSNEYIGSVLHKSTRLSLHFTSLSSQFQVYGTWDVYSHSFLK
jgi:hypothetical protein